jgi:DNA helicase II / ATP-dependent DNA helicase PcrA
LTLPFQLSPEREHLLEADGSVLVLGGPGCGKTSIALLKADSQLQENQLLPGQKVLFLSFARATIARVAQRARELVKAGSSARLEINTYHGFAWSILRSHGYLLSARRILTLLPPPQAAARLAHLNQEQRDLEKLRLFREEGLIHFDLFAGQCADLLRRSPPLAAIISDSYPLIILDEFQDTNAEEWAIVQLLGQANTIIALADPDQRIFEFRGASPARIQEYVCAFKPTIFDFSADNHRSGGTDIVRFANDFLASTHKTKQYANVAIVRYQIYRGPDLCYALKSAVMAGIKRLSTATQPWSIACLVPTRRLMLAVSDCLAANADRLPPIIHDVALDQEGPALAGLLLAGLLDGDGSPEFIAQRLLNDLCTHIRGRRGNDQPPQTELQVTGAIAAFLSTGKIRGKNRELIIAEAARIAGASVSLTHSGDPAHDWLTLRRLLEQSPAAAIQQVAVDARYLRLLTRGSTFRDELGELWRQKRSYRGAVACLEAALRQEHFSSSLRDPQGVQVMTIHKSKGKEFDEVFAFEGYKNGKFIRAGATPSEVAQARLALRVAVTPARRRATILLPNCEPSPFF